MLQGTRSQADAGIKDSVKAFFDDTKKSAKDLARDDLIQVLAGESASAVHWLQDKVGRSAFCVSAHYS
jgi:succinate dehydrogenase/fumarate reductase flavoprotein subunit